MITYAQIEAIREAAMRECEENEDAYSHWDGTTHGMFESADVETCFAKIRAALQGEVNGKEPQ